MTYDPTKPTVYLDWSNLSGAFNSTREERYASHRPLYELVQECTSEANLCLTNVHVMELKAAPRDLAAATAEWLDTLNVTWMESDAESFDERERDWALLIAFGASRPPYSPFMQSFVQLAGANLSRKDREYIHAHPNLTTLLADTVEHTGIYALRRDALEGAKSLWHDGQRAKREGMTEQIMRALLAAKERNALYALLWGSGRALRDRGEFERAGMPNPNDDALHAMCERIADDVKALPGFRMGCAATLEFKLSIQRQDVNARKFERHASAVFDAQHCAAGAAYCDVFTCDADVASYLGTWRTQLGRMRQLSMRECGSPEAFAAAVRGQVRAAAKALTRI